MGTSNLYKGPKGQSLLPEGYEESIDWDNNPDNVDSSDDTDTSKITLKKIKTDGNSNKTKMEAVTGLRPRELLPKLLEVVDLA